MANAEAISGVDTYVVYGAETAYNSEQSTVNQWFGNVKNFTIDVNNTNFEHRAFTGSSTGGRNVAAITSMQLDATARMEFEVTQWNFLQYVIGAENGVGPYTYDEADSPSSLTIHRAIDNPGGSATDQDAVLTGVTFNSTTIRCAVGEAVICTAELHAALVKYDTTIPSNVSHTVVTPFTFTGATLELPNATALSNVIDSVEITIVNNYERLYGLGSRLVVAARAKKREYKIKFTLKYLDNTIFNYLLGATTPTSTGGATQNATMGISFALGGKSADFVFTTVVIDAGSLPGNVNEYEMEDISATAFSLQVTDDRSA